MTWPPPAADLLRFDGRLLDLPVINHPNVLYYNRQLWQAAGLALPRQGWTWDDLRHAAQKLTSGSGDTKIWGLSTNYLMNLPQMYIWQRTGRMPWQADEQTIKETLQLFSTLIFSDQILKPDPLMNRPGWQAQGEEFWAGRAGLYLGRMYDLRRLESQSVFQWEMAPLPTAAGGRPAGVANFTTYSIPSTTRPDPSAPARHRDALQHHLGDRAPQPRRPVPRTANAGLRGDQQHRLRPQALGGGLPGLPAGREAGRGDKEPLSPEAERTKGRGTTPLPLPYAFI